MLKSLGIEVHSYGSASEYLNDPQGRSRCGCLVLDVRLPGMSGMELHKQLRLHSGRVPAIVFITGHGDIPMAVEAMRNGATDFLQKPFKEQQLLDSVQKALALERSWRIARDKSDVLAARLACLTPREHEVMGMLLQGARSKAIAIKLGIVTKTAEEHRANVMHKMHAKSMAELVTMVTATP
jgi:FixJ family two-component response regulator